MDYELTFWIAAGIAGLFAFGVLWFWAKMDAKNYVDMEDWK